MSPDEPIPEDVEEYVVLPAPPGATSQGGTGETVVLPSRRATPAPHVDEAPSEADEAPSEAADSDA